MESIPQQYQDWLDSFPGRPLTRDQAQEIQDVVQQLLWESESHIEEK